MPRPQRYSRLALLLGALLTAVTAATSLAGSPTPVSTAVDLPAPNPAGANTNGPWGVIQRLRDAAARDARSGPPPRPSTTPAAATAAGTGWSVLSGFARRDHAGAYDPVARRLVVIGGRDGSIWPADGWALGPEPDASLQRIVSGLHPTDWYLKVAHNGSLVYDTGNRQLLHFGGLMEWTCEPYCTGGECVVLSSVLALPTDVPRAPHWLNVTAPEGLARRGHAAAYDPRRRRMLVFGGDGAVWNVGHWCAGEALDDLWELSLDDPPAWRRLDQSGQAPGPREWSGAQAVIDSLGDRMYLAREDSLWSLDLATHAWSHLGPIPPPGGRSCLGIDPAAGELIYFSDGRIWTRGLHAGAAWVPLGGATGPAGNLAVAWDPVERRFLAHGARPNTLVPSAVVFEWRRSRGTWIELPNGAHPQALYHAMVYDPEDDSIYSFGGFGMDTTTNDLYRFTGDGPSRWSALKVPNPPSPRAGHSLVLDTRRHRLLLFGGAHESSDPDSALYALNLEPPLAWSVVATQGPSPPPLSEHAAAYDPNHDRMIVHSGFTSAPGAGYSDGLWELDLSGIPTWREIPVAGPKPTPRAFHGSVYDPVADEFVILGGMDEISGSEILTLSDSWTLSAGVQPAWTRRGSAPFGLPDPWYNYAFPSLAYDSARQRVVAFRSTPITSVNLYARASSGNAWRELAWDFEAPYAPGARFWTPMVYDPLRDRVVIAGGEGIEPHLAYDDTRAYTWGAPRRDVSIDVRPGDGSNVVNLTSNGRLPVLVLSEPRFDATTIDVATLRLAGAPVRSFGKDRPAVRFEDANGDGRADLVADFVPAELGVAPGDTVAELTGKAAGNTTIRGRDRIELRGHVGSNRRAETALAAADDRPGHVAIRAARIAPDGITLAADCAGAVAGPGVLELFDVRGRRVGGPAPVALEPAHRRFEIGTGSRLSSGIYFVRLRQSGAVMTSRIVFVE